MALHHLVLKLPLLFFAELLLLFLLELELSATQAFLFLLVLLLTFSFCLLELVPLMLAVLLGELAFALGFLEAALLFVRVQSLNVLLHFAGVVSFLPLMRLTFLVFKALLVLEA